MSPSFYIHPIHDKLLVCMVLTLLFFFLDLHPKKRGLVSALLLMGVLRLKRSNNSYKL